MVALNVFSKGDSPSAGLAFQSHRYLWDVSLSSHSSAIMCPRCDPVLGYVWRVFHLSLRLITFHKSDCKMPRFITLGLPFLPGQISIFQSPEEEITFSQETTPWWWFQSQPGGRNDDDWCFRATFGHKRPPKVMKRSKKWNILHIYPRRDSNSGGSDL